MFVGKAQGVADFMNGHIDSARVAGEIPSEIHGALGLPRNVDDIAAHEGPGAIAPQKADPHLRFPDIGHLLERDPDAQPLPDFETFTDQGLLVLAARERTSVEKVVAEFRAVDPFPVHDPNEPGPPRGYAGPESPFRDLGQAAVLHRLRFFFAWVLALAGTQFGFQFFEAGGQFTDLFAE